jgi:hypothetical protein
LADIGSHVDWMEDAVAIRFATSQREGVGTRFECDTQVGLFRLRDRMAVTEWTEGKVIGIRHDGVVTGTGRFVLKRKGRHRTVVSWTERLRFPWWMAGPAGAVVARPVLKRIWRRNLRNLQRLTAQ